MVHKGVDLLLEAFVEMPGFQLTLCGPIEAEQDFVQAYRKELFETQNIRTIGWVQLESPEFQQVLNSCSALVYPSCSEGQSTAVVTALHAGVIPIASYESGVDIADFGTVLRACSIEEIKEAVRHMAGLSSEELRQRAEATWKYARAYHTREHYAKVYEETVHTILAAHKSRVNAARWG